MFEIDIVPRFRATEETVEPVGRRSSSAEHCAYVAKRHQFRSLEPANPAVRLGAIVAAISPHE
jgi:hypothetical protein